MAGMFEKLRALSDLITRTKWSERGGRTFDGRRDIFKAFGYRENIQLEHMRGRFNRNGVANRIVRCVPQATWHGGFDLVEDEDPRTDTTFEKAWDDLAKRLDIAELFMKVDTLSRLGNFAVLVMGAPGEPITELKSCSADQLEYVLPYSQMEAKVFRWDMDPNSERYGLPLLYTITRNLALTPGLGSSTISKQVHWTRVIHVAEGTLDDRVYGEPALLPVWNLLDDLEKVSGGGAEAFFRHADSGMQFDLDPTLQLEDEALDSADSAVPTASSAGSGIKKQIEEYEHGFRRMLFTRGIKVNNLGTQVADYQGPITATMSLISASTGIPQRVLLGSEQGKLASVADRTNWDDRITGRRQSFAEPTVVRAVVDRFIELGVLPKPKDDYQVFFSQLKIMDDLERANVAKIWAGLNVPNGPIIVMPNEIRENVLELGSLDEAGSIEDIQLMPNKKDVVMPDGTPNPSHPANMPNQEPGSPSDNPADSSSSKAPQNQGDKPAGPDTKAPKVMRSAAQRRRDDARRTRKWTRLTVAEKRQWLEIWEKRDAAASKPAPWKHIHKAMDHAAPAFAKFVNGAFAAGKVELDMSALRKALAAKDHQRVLEIAGHAIAATEKKLHGDMRERLLDVLEAALPNPAAIRSAWLDKSGVDTHGRDAGKVARAKASHVPLTKEKLGKATEQEKLVAKSIGGTHIGGTKPIDIHVTNKSGEVLHGVEVKAIFGKNDKVTMHEKSLARKEKLANKLGAQGHTVAVDMRGPKPTYYHRSGFGSYRLNTMTKVGTSVSKLREHIK